MSDIAFFTAVFATAGIVGGLAGCAVTLFSVRRLIKAWLPKLPHIVSLEKMEIRSRFSISLGEDEEISSKDENHIRFFARGITSQFVATWLEENGLVMSPKGLDFKTNPKVKK